MTLIKSCFTDVLISTLDCPPTTAFEIHPIQSILFS
jgi:hypothetical protein